MELKDGSETEILKATSLLFPRMLAIIRSTLQLHSTTARFPLSFVTLVLIIMIVKWKGVMKVSRRQVKVYVRQFSCIKANMRFTMPCNCSGCWIGWGWGWMNILGVFNTLWHNFVINKPKFELANSVRFTEYLRAIVKSLPPNIYISTSASRFDDT